MNFRGRCWTGHQLKKLTMQLPVGLVKNPLANITFGWPPQNYYWVRKKSWLSQSGKFMLGEWTNKNFSVRWVNSPSKNQNRWTSHQSKNYISVGVPKITTRKVNHLKKSFFGVSRKFRNRSSRSRPWKVLCRYPLKNYSWGTQLGVWPPTSPKQPPPKKNIGAVGRFTNRENFISNWVIQNTQTLQ